MGEVGYWVRLTVRAIGRAAYKSPVGAFIVAWVLDDAGYRRASVAVLLILTGWLGHVIWCDFRSFRTRYLEWRRRQ